MKKYKKNFFNLNNLFYFYSWSGLIKCKLRSNSKRNQTIIIAITNITIILKFKSKLARKLKIIKLVIIIVGLK